MKTYNFNNNNIPTKNIVNQLYLNKPIITGMIMMVVITLILYILLSMLLGSKSAGMAFFAGFGSLCVVIFAINKKKRKLDKLMRMNKVKWDDSTVKFLENDKIQFDWSIDDVTIFHKAESVVYLVSRGNAMPNYVVVSLSNGDSGSFNEFLSRFKKEL